MTTLTITALTGMPRVKRGDDLARLLIAALDANGIAWLEEPFPPHDFAAYKQTRTFGRTPLAAGENHFTRFEFNHVLAAGDVGLNRRPKLLFPAELAAPRLLKGEVSALV